MLQFGVNKTTGSGLFNGIDIWSAIPAAVKAHIARVTADGGTVPNQASMVSSVKKLIAANLWNNCVFFGLPLGGVKKDGNQYVSKVYDLKANADLLQATGTAQPKYDNSNLLYDGGDRLISNNITTDLAATLSNNTTVCFWVNAASSTAFQFVLSRYGTTGNQVFFTNIQPNGKMRFGLFDNSNTICKDYESNSNVITGQWRHYSFTFNSGILKIYVDGIEETPKKTTDLAIGSLRNSIAGISLGGVNINPTLGLSNGSQTALHQIYNTTFTAEQVLWNCNNIRPEGV